MTLMEEDYKMMHYRIVFKSFSPYFEVYNEVLGWMESKGFMSFWRQKYDYYLQRIEDMGPQVLTMDHLKDRFLACLVQLTLSVIVFIRELLMSKIRSLRFIATGKR